MVDLSSPHRKRLILILLALALVLWVLWTTRQSLVPFIIGGVFAYLMAPMVSLYQSVFPRRGMMAGIGQTFAILLIYAIFLSV